MKSVCYALKVITPLFLAGTKTAPELRAPSFRGALRFWLRAIVGGVIGDRNLKKIYETESFVFGSTGGISPVMIRVSARATPRRFTSNMPGVKYLFWSMLRSRREVYMPNEVRSLVLTMQTRSDMSDEPLKMATASLWLLTHLGGIGSRSRRGGGNLQVIEVQGDLPEDLPDLRVQARSPRQLRDQLAEGLVKSRQLLPLSEVTPSFNRDPSFDLLHPDHCRILVLDKTWNTWEQALNEIGEELRRFRNRREPDYSNVKDLVRGRSNSLQTVERAAFGLPIVFYYSSLGDKRGTLEGKIHNRRASPLLIRVIRLASGKHTIVMTFFKTRLLDREEGIALRRGRRVLATADAPDLSLIAQFLEEMKTRIGLLEVKGWAE